MSSIKITIALLLVLCCQVLNAQQKITTRVKNMTCLEAIQHISANSNLSITMGSLQDSGKRYTRTYNNKSVDHILKDLTSAEDIGYSVSNGHIILFPEKKNLISSKGKKKVILNGYVYDILSGEALIGANIYSMTDNLGTSTNAYGYFSITLDEGPKKIAISYIGYTSIEESLQFDQNIEKNFHLQPSSSLEEVVITSSQIERVENQTKMSSMSLPVKELNALPVIGGEVDIIKSLQLMPGVQAGNEGFAGLYVRGGSSDQNLIMLDGVPIYNASHLFGIFSVFNADAIKSTELIKGGYPARFGGRLSSILDIRMKEGNNKEWKAKGSIGLISSKITVEGPIKKDKMSMMLSARRTYADILAKPFISRQRKKDGIEGTPGYHFVDINAKTNYKISNKDRLYFSFYNGGDVFQDEVKRTTEGGSYSARTEEYSSLSWGNNIAALRWNHIFGPKLFANTTLTRTHYDFKVSFDNRTSTTENGETKEATELYKYSSEVNDLTGKIDFDYLLSPAQTVRFGAEIIRHQFTPGVTNFVEEGLSLNRDTIIGGKQIDATKMMAYIEDDIQLGSNFKINLGVNASMFSVENKTYRNIEPRILANFKLAPRWSLKGSYTMMTQYLHLLTNSGIGLPTDLWVPPTKQIEPQKSWQGALGVAHTTPIGIEVSVEGYYKQLDNLITYREGASFLQSDNNWEDKVTVGQGRSYGAELFIKKDFGKTRGWLGYTLSKSDRQFDEINQGERYPFKFDRRHDFSIVANHKLTEKITFGANWVYSSGSAVTLPRREYDAGGSFYYYGGAIDYGTKNSFRQKAYHRLDLSLSYYKKASWGSHSFHINIYNAYNRRNTFYLKVENDYDDVNDEVNEKLKEVTLLPIVPSFRWDFHF